MKNNADDKEKRDNLKEELAGAIKKHAAAPDPPDKPDPRVSQTIIGSGVQIAGDYNGDININTKQIQQHKFTPGPEHISSSQAYKLKQLVYKAAEIEAVSGLPEEEGRKKWWGRLGGKFKASPYQAIPAELGEAAISWLSQEVAKLRPKLRRRDPEAWRKEHYTAIWARAKELGMDKAAVYDLATTKLGIPVTSLTKLTQQALKKFYNIIMGMPKP